MTRFVTMVCLALSVGLLMQARVGAADTKDLSDTDFVTQAVASGMAEVKFGQLAEKQASNEDVKRFAQQIVKDHNDANSKLLVSARGLKIAVVTGLDRDRRTAYDNLAKLRGDEFDREYLRIMVDDHEKAVRMFESFAKSGSKDDDLRKFARDTLPTLKHHLEEARTLSAKLKK